MSKFENQRQRLKTFLGQKLSEVVGATSVDELFSNSGIGMNQPTAEELKEYSCNELALEDTTIEQSWRVSDVDRASVTIKEYLYLLLSDTFGLPVNTPEGLQLLLSQENETKDKILAKAADSFEFKINMMKNAGKLNALPFNSSDISNYMDFLLAVESLENGSMPDAKSFERGISILQRLCQATEACNKAFSSRRNSSAALENTAVRPAMLMLAIWYQGHGWPASATTQFIDKIPDWIPEKLKNDICNLTLEELLGPDFPKNIELRKRVETEVEAHPITAGNLALAAKELASGEHYWETQNILLGEINNKLQEIGSALGMSFLKKDINARD